MTTGNAPWEEHASGPEAADRGTATTRVPSKLEQLERKEGQLWRSALFVLVVLAAAFALLSWETVRRLPHRLEALPVGLVILVALFGAYLWIRSNELARLRGLIRGLEQRAGAPPSERQLEQLFAIISRSQQGYRDLLDTFDDLLLAISLQGEIRAANRSFAELLDRPFHEVIGHRLDEFLDDPDGSARAAADKALPRLLEKRHWKGVIRVRVKKGGSAGSRPSAARYFDCVLRAMVKADRVVGFSCLARDTTQQRESEARFTELFETLQEGVYFTTPEGKLLDANPALVRMLGYNSKEELLEVKVTDLYLDPAQRAAELGELEREGTVHGREVTLRRKDGSTAICLDTSTAIRDPLGRIVRCQGTLLDITQRREMEKRLHAEREFARRLVDSFPDLIVVLDDQRRYTYVSPRIKEALGYQPEELLGHTLVERTHPEDSPALLELYSDLIAGKRTHGIVEYRTRHKQGDWRLFRASASPLYDEQARIVGVVGSARDVTELRQLEQQLLQSEKLAAMGQMIAGVAHELNNPLTAVLGVSELLRERATDDSMRRQLDLAHRQARRAAHIVQNLLAFSRPPTLGKVRLNLADALQRALQLHEHSLRVNKIVVDFLADADLPAVVGDPNQLVQVFLNLITNAEQAIREVRGTGTLQIRLWRAGDSLLATFQDDGPGVPREALPRVFDPFFTTKRPGRGTGLGLSICLAIVREHGGNIEVQSTHGNGARVSVSLPIAAEAQVLPAPPVLSTPQAGAISLQGLSVLLVDDEESIRELVQDGLSAQGLLVDCASTGEQAIDLAAKRPYDAVLCDMNLGDRAAQAMSGRKVFARLMESPGALPGGQKPLFIFMTGSLVDPASLEELSRAGSRVLHKPFRISDLVAILSEALQATGGSQPRQNVLR